MAHASAEQLSSCAGSDGRRLYALVARTFLASLCPDALLEVRVCSIDAGGEAFSVRGQQMLEEGWLRVMPHLAPDCSPLPAWIDAAHGLPRQLAIVSAQHP